MRGRSLEVTAYDKKCIQEYTKVLKYWTPTTINFPFVPNGKLMVFRCPNI